MKFNEFPSESNGEIVKALDVIAAIVSKHNQHVDPREFRQSMLGYIDREVKRQGELEVDGRLLPPLETVGPMRNRGAR